jgi:DNA polymerase-3 subunit alpha
MLDAMISVKDLFTIAKESGQKAIAITEHGTLSSCLDAFNMYKETGVKYIPGMEAYVTDTYEGKQAETGRKRTIYEKRKHLVLLAQNETGWKNLLKLCHIGFQNHLVFIGRVWPRLSMEDLAQYSEGIIATTACASGYVSQAFLNEGYEAAEEKLDVLRNIFPGRLFLELQPHKLKNERIDQDALNMVLIELHEKYNIPLTVGIDVHYKTKASEEYHDVLLAINDKKALDDPSRHRYGISEFYFKEPSEIFNFLSDEYGPKVATKAMSGTVEIANMCDPPDYMETVGHRLPKFDVRSEKDYSQFMEWKNENFHKLDRDVAYMRYKCIESFKQKFGQLNKSERKKRWDRVKNEISVLESNNFSSYMLVVSDYIKWAKNNGILVGVGRGSVGGCMIAYLLDIHGVDPLEHGLLFERFQNAQKKDLPDVDTDFTSAGRDIVQEYVRDKYGEDHCAQVSNINTYTAKSVVPDLARSMKIPDYWNVSAKIKDAIPLEDGKGKPIKTLKDALSNSQRLREFANTYPKLMEYANEIVGLEKEFSTHAAAMVIANEPIINFAPLRVDKNGMTATQYEKNRSEAVGLAKMDFLAISTLDVIDETFKNIRKLGVRAPKTMEDIPLNDAETYQMIQKGNTKCVFQLGKSGMMQSLCKRIKPDKILDIAIINALGRPSSKDERDEFINRRNGKKSVTYLHPSLKCLEETYGICLFEEQLMSVAKDVAGWDLNKADGLRKYTKLKGKNPELAEQLEIDFIKGAMDAHEMEYELALEIWKTVVQKFSGYGFNKSHAIFYSINGYYTAYLKRHFPAAFLAAKLKIETVKNSITSEEEISSAKVECKRLGIKYLPPDINRSSSGYEILDEKIIVMGFSAIKGLGEKAINDITENQPYESLVEFFLKTQGRLVNKTRVEALASGGAFDSLDLSRRQIFENAPKLRTKVSNFVRKSIKKGENPLKEFSELSLKLSDEEWSRSEFLIRERKVLAEVISGTLGELYPGFFSSMSTPVASIKRMPERNSALFEVIIKSELREFIIKKEGKWKGRKMVKYKVSDQFGDETELTVWPTDYRLAKKMIVEGEPVKIIAEVSKWGGDTNLVLKSFEKFYAK